jgi:hypothetical protein
VLKPTFFNNSEQKEKRKREKVMAGADYLSRVAHVVFFALIRLDCPVEVSTRTYHRFAPIRLLPNSITLMIEELD